MKLFEIINPEIVKQPISNLDAPAKKLVNYGFYSNVYDNDEWTVSKEQKWHDDENFPRDGYNFYIDYLIRNNLIGTNPFFPRVYKIKKYQINSKTYYSYDIERLIPLNEASLIQLKHMYYYLFGREAHRPVFTKEHLLSSIVRSMRGALIVNDTKVYNDQFAKAVEILNIIMEKIKSSGIIRNVGWDLGRNNFMMRITNNAPQLVITDPFG